MSNFSLEARMCVVRYEMAGGSSLIAGAASGFGGLTRKNTFVSVDANVDRSSFSASSRHDAVSSTFRLYVETRTSANQRRRQRGAPPPAVCQISLRSAVRKYGQKNR